MNTRLSSYHSACCIDSRHANNKNRLEFTMLFKPKHDQDMHTYFNTVSHNYAYSSVHVYAHAYAGLAPCFAGVTEWTDGWLDGGLDAMGWRD